jgi:hypothetical protein
MRGIVDVDVERDHTRPLFHKAYAASSVDIPESLARD